MRVCVVVVGFVLVCAPICSKKAVFLVDCSFGGSKRKRERDTQRERERDNQPFISVRIIS